MMQFTKILGKNYFPYPVNIAEIRKNRYYIHLSSKLKVLDNFYDRIQNSIRKYARNHSILKFILRFYRIYYSHKHIKFVKRKKNYD